MVLLSRTGASESGNCDVLTSVWGSDGIPTDPGMKQWRAETLPRQTWAHALRIACRALADDQTGIVSRISISGAFSDKPGAARDLLRLGELAREHDLNGSMTL